MKKGFLKLGVLVAVFLVVGLAGSCYAKDFPTKPITVICNYGAGGGTDLATRALCNAAEKMLGVPINVVNKAGGSGSIGIIETKNSKNDGYTVGLLTFAPMAIVPHQIKVPYVPADFDYICTFGQYGYGICVNSESNYKSIGDLVELARNTPGGLGYSASGYPQPFAMQAVGEKEGVKFNYIPYASAAEVLTAVLGGHVQFAVGGQAEITQYMKADQLRLLASATNMRWDTAPEIPTLQELGYDAALISFMGLGTPKGVPADRLELLRDTFKKAYEDEQFQTVMRNMNFAVSFTDGPAYEEFVHKGYKEYEKKMKEAVVVK